MLLMVILEKYPNDDGSLPSVVTAWDEYTIDENQEGWEEEVKNAKATAERQGGEVRVVQVEVPDNFLELPFLPPVVKGKVKIR